MELHLDAPNIGELEKQYLVKCLDSSFVSTYGPFVPEFEEKFSKLLGSCSAVSTQSGTAGLHIALYELGIGAGDEVIVPVLTFAATINPIKFVGAKPVFVDVDIDTWNMDPDKLQEAITPKTKAIIPVHLYGNPSAMDQIMEIAEEHNLYVIEDATESLCSTYGGVYTGTIGHFGIFSFNGNKVITTGGGGMVVGKNVAQLDHIRFLVNQARDGQNAYFHSEVGFNYRMTNLEASLGLAQLERLEGFIETKRNFHQIYSDTFKNEDNLVLQSADPKAESSWWLTSVTINLRAVKQNISDIQEGLKKVGVPTRRIFMPIVEFPPYKDDDRGKYKNAYFIYENGLNLPSSTLNNKQNIKFAAESLLSVINR